jgi:hypothetical protein
MPRPGHAFYTGEPVQFGVTVSGPRQRLGYTVTDDRGLSLRSGAANVGLGQGVEVGVPGTLPPGWYRLRLAGAEVQAEEAFCVIPRPWEEPGDYQLFALHPDDWSPESLQAAAQIGVRHIRHNILWPNSEPERDQWDWEYIQRGYGWAQRSGQQMLAVLGYTPIFQGQRAENCHLWIENANFTWHPREPDEFARYARTVMDYARGKAVQWPPAGIVPRGETVVPESVPWVCGWEMWNEVDLSFYFGDWNRYCELLHLVYACSRQRTPETPVLYGGSTGNWPAMCMLVSGSGRYTYDYNTFHPDHEITSWLSEWYSGAPQIPYCVGLPRETIHTEAYATVGEGADPRETYQETPGDLLRLYVTLKAWREVGYYRSGCLGGWIDDGHRAWPGTSLLVRTSEGLRPTPLYPAFAAARLLLSDATLVGPLKQGSSTSGYAFLKRGRTMVAAWSDAGAEVTLELEPGAYRVDAMGRRFDLGGRDRYRRRLDGEPLVIVGAKPGAYLPQALRQEYALLAETYYGVPPWPSCHVWYTNKLQQDVAEWAGTDGPARLLRAVRKAARAMAREPGEAPGAVAVAQAECGALMARVVGRCEDGDGLDRQAANTLWRLARVSEWLGQVADAGAPAGAAEDHARAGERLQQVRATLGGADGGAIPPFTDKLLDRARRDLSGGAGRTGFGARAAAEQKTGLAERLGQVESRVALQVVPLVDFVSARLMRKALLLEPGQEHILRLWVQNLRPEPVAGTLTVTTPALWEPAAVTVAFSAPADGASAVTEVRVTLPEEPRPWVRRSSFTLDGDLNVELPATLRDQSEIIVSGELSSGECLATVRYFVNVGRSLDAPTVPPSAEGALRTQLEGLARGLIALALPPL